MKLIAALFLESRAGMDEHESDSAVTELTPPQRFGAARRPLHPWWGRRRAGLARVALYLALTQHAKPDNALLAKLIEDAPDPESILRAHDEMRDARWRWHLPETEVNRGNVAAPEEPVVLDPFGGSGAFALEAARLGMAANTSDLSPLAYHLMLATLRYPSSYGASDRSTPGTATGGSWAGLTSELSFWARRMSSIAAPHLNALEIGEHPPAAETPSAYIWLARYKCPSCSTVTPMRRKLRDLTKDGTSLFLELTDTGLKVRGEPRTSPQENPRVLRCLHCNSTSPPSALNQSALASPVLLGEVANGVFGPYSTLDESRGRLDNAAQAKILQLAERNQILLEKPFLLRASRCVPYATLFSDRQQLLLLAFVDAGKSAHQEMLDRGIVSERALALTTYLSFFLGYVADNSSKASHWSQRSRRIQRATSRVSISLTSDTFIERSAIGLVDQWLTGVIANIEELAPVRGTVRIELSSATALPWPDESVDAIVTDPPYYDNIDYPQLSNFFWMWERALLECEPTKENRGEEAKVSPQPATTDADGVLRRSLEEMYRVLRQSRTLCLFLTALGDTDLARYIDLSKSVGFEFFMTYRVKHYLTHLASSADSTYLIILRKPLAFSFSEPTAVETNRVLESLETGSAIFYAGLAEKLVEALGADVSILLPPNAKGTQIEQLMEVLADGDVRTRLREVLGVIGIRQVANAIALQEARDTPDKALDAILVHFGFTIPEPLPRGGPFQAMTQLSLARDGLKQISRDLNTITSEITRAALAVQSLLRTSVFGWASRENAPG